MDLVDDNAGAGLVEKEFRIRQRQLAQGLERFSFSRSHSSRSFLAARRSGDPGLYCPPGDCMLLTVGEEVMRSDTKMERDSNHAVVERAHGDVLVAGLGIGMIRIPGDR
ncbi:MAG: hypothetical protein NTW86_25425 [Candidatus Sumerlaeota bacterium]|nr:hypothetical protein [Candidatus Sumerlaeota bacterium]